MTTTPRNPTLEAALGYLDHGWSVIPINPNTKMPLVSWSEYQQRLARPGEVEDWWTRWPWANVGVVTGRISDIVVVDVDTRKGGQAEPILEQAPTGMRSQTGGGGWHLIYEYPTDGQPVPNKVGIGEGIDIRADGGYIVVPPSRHSSGERYRWSATDRPESMPAGMLAAVRTARPRTSSSGDNPAWVSDLLENGADQGGRNDSTARLAGYLAGKGIPEDVVHTLLTGWNRSKNIPPLPDEEIRITIESVYRTDRRRTGDSGRIQMDADSPNAVHSGFTLVPFGAYMAEHGDTRVEWVVDGWLPVSTIAFMVAAPESFKTWMLLDLALSVATGEKFLGQFEIKDPGPVLLIQQEDHHGGLAQRLGIIAYSKLGLGVSEDAGSFQCTLPPDVPIYIHPDRQLKFDNVNVMDQLEAYVQELRPKLILIDPLYSAASQDDYMAKAIEHMWRLKKMRDKYGCGFVLAHHTKKGVEGTAREGLWGSQFLNAFLETGWQIRRAEQPNTVTVRRHFKITESKQETNLQFDIRTDAPPYYYKVNTVEGGQGENTSMDLVDILLNEGPQSTDALAEKVGVHVTTVRRKLKALEKDGMVVKNKDGLVALANTPPM